MLLDHHISHELTDFWALAHSRQTFVEPAAVIVEPTDVFNVRVIGPEGVRVIGPEGVRVIGPERIEVIKP